MQNTVLILGATGRAGRHAHIAFRDAGWRVRLFDRARDDLWDAAWGADVIFNGWNPAYSDWAREIPAQTTALIDVAEATGALVVIPGNVYPYGQSAGRMGPMTPHVPTGALGKVRADMEAAWAASRARVLVLRCGDFLDTEASGNWFDKVIVAGLDRGRFSYPGALDVSHAWAFLPDVGRALVQLVEKRHSLPRFADIPFAGFTLTGLELSDGVARATARRHILRRMSWLPLGMAAPFWPVGRCLQQMRYLWDLPHWLDPDPLKKLLPDFRGTDLETALALAVAHQIDPDKPVTRGPLYIGRARIA
ncbi:epimerase [Actibacterium sp. 188UL27-1]|nr:epimerase [Actibacterium sp. 188UL27-1]